VRVTGHKNTIQALFFSWPYYSGAILDVLGEVVGSGGYKDLLLRDPCLWRNGAVR
jgi:hypothetical protein